MLYLLVKCLVSKEFNAWHHRVCCTSSLAKVITGFFYYYFCFKNLKESQSQELKCCMRLLARSALLHPTQNKASVQQPHSSACAALGPHRFPLAPACPGSTARHGYSKGCFLFPRSGCSASLSEETPSHWILDERMVSRRKGYVHPLPSLGWQWPKEVVLEAHPLAPRWRREHISRRRKSGQTKGCLYSISHQPSLFSSPLALALSAYIYKEIQLPRARKGLKQKRKVRLAPEIILVHLFCWC